jgi:hypothetical protein
MTNETSIECYCRSDEMAKLCQGSKDIVIRFKASYPPNKKPVFKIYAEAYHRGGKGRKELKGGKQSTAVNALLLCPWPCQGRG